MDMLVETQTVCGGSRPMLGFPVHFNGRNAPAVSAAPRLGQHSVQVLQECGFSNTQIEELLASGCLQQLEQHKAIAAEGVTA